MEKSHKTNYQTAKELLQQKQSEVKIFLEQMQNFKLDSNKQEYEVTKDNEGTFTFSSKRKNPNLPKLKLIIYLDGRVLMSEGIHYIDTELLKQIIQSVFCNKNVNSDVKCMVAKKLFPCLPSNACLFFLEFLKQSEDIEKTDYIEILREVGKHISIWYGFYGQSIVKVIEAELTITIAIECAQLAAGNDNNDVKWLAEAEQGLAHLKDLNYLNNGVPGKIEKIINSLKETIGIEHKKRLIITQISELEKIHDTPRPIFSRSLSKDEGTKRNTIVREATEIKKALESKKTRDEKPITPEELQNKIKLFNGKYKQKEKNTATDSSKNFYPCLEKLIAALGGYEPYLQSEKKSTKGKESAQRENFSTILEEIIKDFRQNNSIKSSTEKDADPIQQRIVMLQEKTSLAIGKYNSNYYSEGDYDGIEFSKVPYATSMIILKSYSYKPNKVSLLISSTGDIMELKIDSTEGKFIESLSVMKKIFLEKSNSLEKSIPLDCKVSVAKAILAYLPTDIYFIASTLLLHDKTKALFKGLDYLEILLQCVKLYPLNNCAYDYKSEISVFSILITKIAKQYIQEMKKIRESEEYKNSSYNSYGKDEKNKEKPIPLETWREHFTFILNTMLAMDKDFPEITRSTQDFSTITESLFQTCIKLAIDMLSTWMPKSLATSHDLPETQRRRAIIYAAFNIIENDKINEEKIAEFIEENDKKIIAENSSSKLGIGESKSFQPNLTILIGILKQYQDYCRRKELVSEIKPDKSDSNEDISSSSHYKSDYQVAAELRKEIKKEYEASFSAATSSSEKEETKYFFSRDDICTFNNVSNFLTVNKSGMVTAKVNYIDIAFLKEIIAEIFASQEKREIEKDSPQFCLAKGLFPYLTMEAYLFFLEYLNSWKIDYQMKIDLLKQAIAYLPIDNGLYPKNILTIIRAELEIDLGKAYLEQSQSSEGSSGDSLKNAREHLEAGCKELSSVITSEGKVKEINVLFETLEFLLWKDKIQKQIYHIIGLSGKNNSECNARNIVFEIRDISALLQKQTQDPGLASIAMTPSNENKDNKSRNLTQQQELVPAIKSFLEKNSRNSEDNGFYSAVNELIRLFKFKPRSPKTISVATSSKASQIPMEEVKDLNLNVDVNKDTGSISGLKTKFIETKNFKFILLIFLNKEIAPQCKIDLAKALFAYLPTKTYITYFNLLLEAKIFQDINFEAYLDILFTGLKEFPVANGAFDKKEQEELLAQYKNKIIGEYSKPDDRWLSAADKELMLKDVCYMFDLYQELEEDIDNNFEPKMKELFHICIKFITTAIYNWSPAFFSTTLSNSDKMKRRQAIKESVMNLISEEKVSEDKISQEKLIKCLALIHDELEENAKTGLVGRSEKFVPQSRKLDKLLTEYFKYCLGGEPEGLREAIEKERVKKNTFNATYVQLVELEEQELQEMKQGS